MNHSIVITGGANGMGRAVAEKLADSGYIVYSLDIKQSGKTTENIHEIITDVRSQQSIDDAFEIVSTQTDSLDAILNFAGIIMMNSLVEIPEKDFHNIFDVNFFGAYRINKTFLPLILKNKGKIVITTSELAPNKIIPFNSIYSISKKALDAYAEGLRMELGLLGIKVITLRPGAVATELIDNSNNALAQMKANTVLYKTHTDKFQKIMDGEQGTAIPASKIADLVLKILNKKRPKYIYSKNASAKLKLLNAIPTGLQVKLYKKLLK